MSRFHYGKDLPRGRWPPVDEGSLEDGVDWDVIESSCSQDPRMVPQIPYHLLNPPTGLDSDRHPSVQRVLPAMLEWSRYTHELEMREYYLSRNLSSSGAPDPISRPRGPFAVHSAFTANGQANPLFQYSNDFGPLELNLPQLDPEPDCEFERYLWQMENGLKERAPLPEGPSIVYSMAAFQRNLESFVGINLQAILSSDVFVAGSSVILSLSNQLKDIHINADAENRTYRAAGAVLGSLQGIELPNELQQKILDLLPSGKDLRPLSDHFNEIAPNSDVDIFLVADSLEEGEKKHRRVLEHLTGLLDERNVRWEVALDTQFATTIACGAPIRNIQVVRMIVKDREEMLSLADLDCCSLLYDGTQVYCSDRALRALNTRTNWVPYIEYGCRPRKYEKYGFRRSTVLGQRYEEDYSSRLNLLYRDFPPKYHPSITLDEILGQDNANQTEEEESNDVESQIAESEEEESNDVESQIAESQEDAASVEEYQYQATWMRTARAKNLGVSMRCLNCNRYHAVCFNEEIRSFCFSCRSEWDDSDAPNLEDAHILVIGGVESAGYLLALQYLYSGARVTVASRFPQLLAGKILSESNHEEWYQRLTLIGLDLLDYSVLEEFLQFLELPDQLQSFTQIHYCTPTLPFSEESAEESAESEFYPIAREFRSSLPNSGQSWDGRITALMVTIPSILAQRIDSWERSGFVFRVLLQCGSMDLAAYDLDRKSVV